MTNPQKKPSSYCTPDGIILDEWQYQALNALLQGKHLIVDAPTSAGKTRVIEAFLEYHLKAGGTLIYTSPIKSLSNDKYRDFVEKYGTNLVGINTGDFKENLRAPILLATLETYRNGLLGIDPDKDRERRVVVYDEYHYLQDESRGSAWEESLILTPPSSQLILLSASVPNCHDFARWITGLTGRETQVVAVTERPVPLVHMVYTNRRWVRAETIQAQKAAEQNAAGTGALRPASGPPPRSGRLNPTLHTEALFAALDADLGPIMVYTSRRNAVEDMANTLSRTPHVVPDLSKLHERLKNLPGWEYVPPHLNRMITQYGIAFHHSGLMPASRLAIEILLKEGLLRICCGTMGLSLGVNFAVRGAYIADTTRPGEQGEVPYSNTEIMQMLGRAGRRGQDAQGFSLWPSWEQFQRQQPRKREDCVSSLKFDPTTIIGILGRYHSLDMLYEFYKKSFFIHTQPAYVTPERTSRRHTKSKDYREAVQLGFEPKSYRALQKIIGHLQSVGALEGESPTPQGQIARCFPQVGGLIVARWIYDDLINEHNFEQYLQAIASFCMVHFKEVPLIYADVPFLESLQIPKLLKTYYPVQLFPDLYEESRDFFNRGPPTLQFREHNWGAASILAQWLDPKTKWPQLMSKHGSKYLSDGDCMNVLFRFATFLQGFMRLVEHKPELVKQARRVMNTVMREPLDARHRLLMAGLENDNATHTTAD